MQEILDAYSADSSTRVKSAVKQVAAQVKKDIQTNAPVDSGRYRTGWTTKKMDETETTLEMTVYNKPRYMLAHLLENGHAKRGGGRVAARPHIAPAEKEGIEMLEALIKEAMEG